MQFKVRSVGLNRGGIVFDAAYVNLDSGEADKPSPTYITAFNNSRVCYRMFATNPTRVRVGMIENIR